MKKSLSGIWALENKQDHKMIGAIRFDKLDIIAKRAEIGYFFASSLLETGAGNRST